MVIVLMNGCLTAVALPMRFYYLAIHIVAILWLELVYLLTKRLDCFDKLGDDYFGHIVVEAYKLMNGAEDDGDYSLSTILFDCFKDNEEKLKQLLSHKMEGRNVLLHIAFEMSRDS